MSSSWSFHLLARCLICGFLLNFICSETRAQNTGDHQLRKSIMENRNLLISAATEGDDKKLSQIFVRLMAELHYYKIENNISEGIATSSCQRAYEELAVSASSLSAYVQPRRHIAGPADRDKDGREADQWWSSHRESFEDCERYLRVEPTPRFGPKHLTSVLPPLRT
jgi:hypothetical protein